MKATEITPEKMRCMFQMCPAIYDTDQGTYIIVGRKLKERLKEIPRLKVGPEEEAIEVPKDLLKGLNGSGV